jgi:hypothetical protein
MGSIPNDVPSPLAVENLGAEHGRGIHLMKLAMDEVLFERQGTEVRIVGPLMHATFGVKEAFGAEPNAPSTSCYPRTWKDCRRFGPKRNTAK